MKNKMLKLFLNVVLIFKKYGDPKYLYMPLYDFKRRSLTKPELAKKH